MATNLKPLPLFVKISAAVAVLTVTIAVYVAMSGRAGYDPTISPGATATVTGNLACLPHKGAGDGPTTQECAFGLKSANGNHYGLGGLTQDAMSTPMQARVQVTGSLTPAGSNETYDIVGTIQVKDFQRLD